MDIRSVQAAINNCKGLCVEIGGPTPHGYEFIRELGLTLPANILVTNISNPVTLNPFGENPEQHHVDAVIDIQHLPYKKGSVDMIITSSLPHKLHKTLLTESAKVLRESGLLVIENEQPEDKELANQSNFEPLLDTKIANRFHSQIYQLVGIA